MNIIKKTSNISTNNAEIDLGKINLRKNDTSQHISEDDYEKSVNVNIVKPSSKISNNVNKTIVGGAKKVNKPILKSTSINKAKKSNNPDESSTDNQLEKIEETEEAKQSKQSNQLKQLKQSKQTGTEQIIKKAVQSTLLHSPYIETSLRCPIMLNPTQMDNKLELYLKANLNNYTKGRCFLNYGFVVKINKIEETSDGRIEEEDSSCSAKFIVKFSCRLCLPAKNKEIICKIDRMNKVLLSAINGPIKAIITPDKINEENFFIDTDRNIRIKNTSTIIEPEMYIKVLILQSTFSHYDTNIIAISFLQNIATEQEIMMFDKEQYFNQN